VHLLSRSGGRDAGMLATHAPKEGSTATERGFFHLHLRLQLPSSPPYDGAAYLEQLQWELKPFERPSKSLDAKPALRKGQIERRGARQKTLKVSPRGRLGERTRLRGRNASTQRLP